MTRANTEHLKYTPWFAKAGAACSIVPISRFVNERIFALKGGGYPRRPPFFRHRRANTKRSGESPASISSARNRHSN
jgi:hypothetical protein